MTRFTPCAVAFLPVLALCSSACTSPSYETWGAELPAAQRVVVLFHGYGALPTDLKGMAIDLKAAGAPEDTCYVLVAGPVSVLGGGAAWYENGSEATELRPKVLALLEKLRKKAGATYGQIFTGGFSQGAAVAIDAALFSPEPLGGVIAVAPTADPSGEWAEAMQRQTPTRFLLVPGKSDTRVAFTTSRKLGWQLTAAGHSARLVEHSGGHTIAQETYSAMAELLGGSD